jgi:hypothetical protein
MEGVNTTSQKLVRTALPPSIAHPDPGAPGSPGVCIQEFAANIQKEERVVPKATIIEENQRMRSEILFVRMLDRITPRNTDSRKNAKNTSRRIKVANTSPTNLENSDQFIPNWNSISTPVGMPIATVVAKSFIQNHAISL